MPGFFQERPLEDLTDRIIRDSEYPLTGGAFGDVYKCRCIDNDASGFSLLVAVKSVRCYEAEVHLKRHKVFRRELGFLKRLEHPNIVPLWGVTSGFGPLPAIVSPWMLHGDLNAYLKRRGHVLEMTERLQLAHGIVSGLQYLHSIPVIHGDLHSGNVLIDEDHNARITDFGLASTIGNLQPGLSYLERLSSSANPGAVRWAAPERLNGCKLDPSADIYSFGCIMFQLMCGDIPWKDKRSYQVIALKLTAHEPPSRPICAAVKEEHWALMVKCWSPIPRERPMACEVVVAVHAFYLPSRHGYPDRVIEWHFLFFFSTPTRRL